MEWLFNKIILSVMAVSMLLALGVSFYEHSMEDFETVVVKTKQGKEHVLKVEIADTPEERAKGLMFRDVMPENHGMLFKFGDPRVLSFWMKNTYIPLDIIFIASNGSIKKIHKMATPKSLEKISSEVPVLSVLEINGGLSKKLGIKKGDRIILD